LTLAPNANGDADFYGGSTTYPGGTIVQAASGPIKLAGGNTYAA